MHAFPEATNLKATAVVRTCVGVIAADNAGDVLERQTELLLKDGDVRGVEVLLLELGHCLAAVVRLAHGVVDLVEALYDARRDADARLVGVGARRPPVTHDSLV